MMEELGLEPRIERPLWVVENLYEQDGARYHEASLYYLASLPETSPEATAAGSWTTAELDGTPLLNQWHPIDSLESVNLVPSFLRTSLRAIPDALHYILHRDSDT